jgi:hypothetical protein
MQHQVRLEALGGTLAFDAAAKELDLTYAWVVMRNDAVGALAALCKGCSSSTLLQQCAMLLAMLHRTHWRHPLFLHAPGSDLVFEGVDDLSRDTAAEVAGPVSSPLVRDRALLLAQALGWELTPSHPSPTPPHPSPESNAFASESNLLLQRFFASYAEPLAESEDAFGVGDWDRSQCFFCGHSQREVLYAFPPTALLNRFVAKARIDGARATLVTPWRSRPRTGPSSFLLRSFPMRMASSGCGDKCQLRPTRTFLASWLCSPSTSPRGATDA